MTNEITPQSTTVAGILGNGWSLAPAASQDGRWLTFASDSTNLSTPDAGGLFMIYLKDTQTGALTPISLSAIGRIPNSNSTVPVISDDGRYVAFQSYATNLAGTDKNNVSDIFWKDTQTGTLKLLSSTGGTAGDNASGSPAISADGRYVVFQSRADNLASDDTNGAYDIYLADTQTGSLTPISRNAQNSFGDQNSVTPSLSANGQVVAFASDATNLVANDNNVSRDVFIKNAQTGAITLVSTTQVTIDNNLVEVAAGGRSDSPALSADGSKVAFMSYAPDLGKPIDPNNYHGYGEIYVKDLGGNAFTPAAWASTDATGQQANGNCWSPVISQTGQYVAFLSDATNLVPGDTNGLADVFVKDISSGQIIRLSADSLGGQIYRGPELNKAISISDNGQWIFFSATSSASNDAEEVFKAANPLYAGGTDTHTVVLDSKTSPKTIPSFVSGTDKISVSQAALPVGNHDTTLDGAIVRPTPGGFAPTAELVILTANISGAITFADAATTIGSATSAYKTGDHALFVVDNGAQSAVFYFTAAAADAGVSASELTLIGTLTTTSGTIIGDYLLST